MAVPAVEAVVSAHRLRFDVAAGWGVPAHVTVLYPFVTPDRIDEAVIAALTGAAASVPRFQVRWGGTGWFDEDVLWLAPDPDAPFRALTAAVFRAFPDYPPYQGEYTDLVPHLTVGSTGTSDDLRAAERAVLPHLPITSEVTHVQLMCGSPTAGSWRILHDIPLGGGCAAGSTPV